MQLYLGCSGAIAGLIGLGLKRLNFDSSTLLLGFVLGPMIEEHFRRAMIITAGDFGSFFERPVSAVFLLATTLLFVFFIARFILMIARNR